MPSEMVSLVEPDSCELELGDEELGTAVLVTGGSAVVVPGTDDTSVAEGDGATDAVVTVTAPALVCCITVPISLPPPALLPLHPLPLEAPLEPRYNSGICAAPWQLQMYESVESLATWD